MILEEETFKKFGYYPSDLKPQSVKRILAACDDCGIIREIRNDAYHPHCNSCAKKGERHPSFGKHPSEITKKKMSIARLGKHHTKKSKKKMSDAHKGEKNYNYGKHLSEAHKKKLSDANKGANNYFWKGGKIKRVCLICGKKIKIRPSIILHGGGKYCSPSCNRKARRFPAHHTKPERIFERICKNNNLPFKYTGDGSFWIKNINPDFIECNGKKITVEIFGDYWHSPLLNPKLREDRTLPYRKRILKKYGWKLIVFWESDLKRKDAESFILNKLERI